MDNHVVAMLEEAENPLILPHEHADLDAIGAAVGLVEALGRGQVLEPADVKPPGQQLLEDIDLETVTADGFDADAIDVVVVVDSPSTSRTAAVDLLSAADDLLLIDHHTPGDLTERADAALVDVDAGATAELVAGMVEEAGWSLGADGGFALAAGLLSDTGKLARGTPEQHRLAGELLEAAGDRQESVRNLIHPAPNRSERFATATGVVRATGHVADDTIVLLTEVGGHETAIARSLLSANADIAIVLSAQDDSTRVVARTGGRGEEFDLPSGLFRPLADEFGGDGGGHTGAGVASLDTVDTDAVRAEILSLTETLVGAPLDTID